MSPPSAEVALEAARSHAHRGDAWRSLCSIREALEGRARTPATWAGVVELAGRIGDEHGAVCAAERLHRESPDRRGSTIVLADVLTAAGRADRAVALLLPLSEGGALDREEEFRFSRMLMMAGRLDEAQQRARRLLSADPDNPAIWERIAQTRRFHTPDGDVDTMRRLLDRCPGDRPAGLASLAGALARAAVDLGDDALAARCLAMKAGANAQRFPFSVRVLADAVADVQAWCDGAEPDPATASDEGSGRVAFILAPPRSGSSLLDQVFSRHPLIAGGGELRHFWLCTRELGECSRAGVDRWDVAARHATGGRDPWPIIGQRYLALADERFGAGARFTDKLLSNVFRVRAIRRALPRARLIALERSPLDVAWSCWRAQFDADSPWSSSPDGIAAYLLAYRHIMAAWRRRYPEAIVGLAYEQLVREPDVEIPRILAACGLADNPATRQPQYSTRPVATLSFAQVREPIGTHSIGSAAAFPLATRELRKAIEAAGLPLS